MEVVIEIGIARMVEEREEEEEGVNGIEEEGEEEVNGIEEEEGVNGREDHGGGEGTDPEGVEGKRSSGRLIQVCIRLLYMVY